jgi:hypothetical protein
MIHSAFTKIPGGALDLARRCEALSCEGHCVCAPQDQKCPYSPTIGACTDVSTSKLCLRELLVCAPQDQKCLYSPTIGACTDISTSKLYLRELLTWFVIH